MLCGIQGLLPAPPLAHVVLGEVVGSCALERMTGELAPATRQKS